MIRRPLVPLVTALVLAVCYIQLVPDDFDLPDTPEVEVTSSSNQPVVLSADLFQPTNFVFVFNNFLFPPPIFRECEITACVTTVVTALDEIIRDEVMRT